MPAQLVALTEGSNILLDKPILLLGRHPECDIQIDSRKISRRHCCIAQIEDHLIIRDLGSTNGIRINGVRVQEGKLCVDDEVTIAVQVMGKLRDTITVAKGLPRAELEALALASPNVARTMEGAAPKKVIVVPDRLVNLVI